MGLGDTIKETNKTSEQIEALITSLVMGLLKK